MDDHEQIENHEKRITDSEGKIRSLNERTRKLEDNTSDMKHRLDELSDEVKRGNAANATQNDFLMKQNGQMLSLLGGIQQKKQESRIVSWQSAGKIAVSVSAIVGLVTVIINLIFH